MESERGLIVWERERGTGREKEGLPMGESMAACSLRCMNRKVKIPRGILIGMFVLGLRCEYY